MTINYTGTFNQLWRAANRPTMTVIGAISTWSLPAGYSYSKRADRIVNSSGVPQTLDATWYANAKTTVNFVPTRASQETQAMVASGLLPTGSRDVFVLAADITAIDAAWAIEINGERYHVRGKTGVPDGAAQMYRLRLAHE